MLAFNMRKILVAEDDRNLSRSMDTWLTLEGFQVVTVYNGEEALNKLVQNSFDLLITDIAMPRLNGVELISRIRMYSPQLPILVVSGKINADLISDLHEMSIDYILPKPIKPMEFRKIIGQLFSDQIYA